MCGETLGPPRASSSSPPPACAASQRRSASVPPPNAAASPLSSCTHPAHNLPRPHLTPENSCRIAKNHLFIKEKHGKTIENHSISSTLELENPVRSYSLSSCSRLTRSPGLPELPLHLVPTAHLLPPHAALLEPPHLLLLPLPLLRPRREAFGARPPPRASFRPPREPRPFSVSLPENRCLEAAVSIDFHPFPSMFITEKT